jgi:cytochrome bd-type quinol oxidase subunit 2
VDKKTLVKLIVCYFLTLAMALALLHTALGLGWLSFAPSDRAAAPIVLTVVAVVLLMVIFAAVGVGLYVYRDARRRGMEPLLWSLMAIFVPYFLGLIIYLIARQPLQAACPACGARSPEKAAFCPACGRSLIRTCARCQAPLESQARFCQACGQAVPSVG